MSSQTPDPANPFGGPQPVCPRHPDTVAYTRCQRCGRPACGRCQRPAAVGFHCVDCVQANARVAPGQRTVLGAPAERDARPLVTWSIIAVCVVVWLAQMASPAVDSAVTLVPAWGEREPWRFLTSAFAHSTGSLMHIGFNMYALALVGPPLERLLGRWRYLALYLVCALAGGAMFLLLNPVDDPVGLVGASGAVFGLFGATLVLSRRLGGTDGGMLAVILINFAIGFLIPNIAWQGHLGGVLAGALAAFGITQVGREHPARHWWVLGGLALLCCAAIALRYATAPAPAYIG